MFSTQNFFRVAEAEGKVKLTQEQEEKLSISLTASSYPGNGVTSVEGKRYSPFTLYKSIFFFDEAIARNDPSLLAIACEYGSFEGFVRRLELNEAIITDDKATDSEKNTAKLILDSDLEQLGKIYWTVGYLHGARILLNIGEYYEAKADEDYSGIAQDYFERAAKHYFSAVELFPMPTSQELIELTYRGKGLSACGWGSVNSAQSDVLKHIEISRGYKLHDEVKATVRGFSEFDEDARINNLSAR